MRLGEGACPLGGENHLCDEAESILSLASIGRKLRKLFTLRSLERVILLAASLPRSMVKLADFDRQARRAGRKLHLVILMESMGDGIAGEPVVRELADESRLLVWVVCRPYGDLVRHNPVVDGVLELTCVSEWQILDLFLRRVDRTTLLMDGVTCAWFGLRFNNPNPHGIRIGRHFLFGSLLDCYGLLAIGRRVDSRPGAHPDPAFDPLSWLKNEGPESGNGFIAFHCSAREAERTWPAERFRQVADWVLNNTSYGIVEFGLEPILTETPLLRRLGSTLPLNRQMGLLAQAVLFVGVDSGFAHMANACHIPSVVVLGQYKGVSDQMFFSGPWRRGEGCRFVRTEGALASLSASEVIDAVRSQLDGVGMCQWT